MPCFTPNQYPVRLDDDQRQRLEEITRNGHSPAKKIRHARVLLLADRNRPWTASPARRRRCRRRSTAAPRPT